jgi:sRNA-binding carbon storage regulator CsrA
MLSLNRRKGERIVIEYPDGEQVIIELVKVKTSSVLIGAKASEKIIISRGERVERNKITS